MIRLQPQLFEALQKPDGLHASLQSALQLEHATIPAYLYAMYSLDAARNGAIVEVLKSVVVEEMLHLTLAANVLNAIGGAPHIDDPHFIPDYPGPLPGAIGGSLIVRLDRFSPSLVHDVFMEIEEPEEPLDFPSRAAAAAPPPETIGAFYRAIQDRIRAEGEGIFVRPPRHQVTHGLPGIIEVTDSASALRALDLIIEQGEGTSTSPLDPEGDFAHYYRFAEVFHGRRLRPNPNAPPGSPPSQRYIYDGDPIPLDPAGIRPAPANPKAAHYPPGSAARHACDTFNYTYTSLLKTLHAAFNGRPDQLRPAVGLMFSLRQLGLDMMTGTNLGGTTVGPSFEYLPVIPS